MTAIPGYEWGLEETPPGRLPRWRTHRLRPIGTPAGHVLCAAATVRVAHGSKRTWIASVAYVMGGKGQSQSGFTSLAAAKAWAESQLTGSVSV